MPPSEPAQSLNMKLLSHHTLNGHGGMGEGMGLQLAKDGRRILWLAHESAPKNFTAVDVSDPRAPKVVVQTDLPHAEMRSNSLETSGDVMAVAYQVSKAGLKPAPADFSPAFRFSKHCVACARKSPGPPANAPSGVMPSWPDR